jgi:AraC-like DNA-binding protein
MPRTAVPLSQACSSLRRYAGEYAGHEHAHAQVLVGLAGNLQLELNGHSAFVDASCALVVPAGVSHAYLAEAPAQVLVIDTPMRRGLERVRRFAPPAAWRIEPQALEPDAVVDAVAGAPVLLPRRRLDLDALNERIDAALHHGWTNAELAAVCALSPQRFHARFVELTGMTPLAHVRQRRLDHAARLLRAGWPLEMAAAQVGYASASALAFALRRDRGEGARSLRRVR